MQHARRGVGFQFQRMQHRLHHHCIPSVEKPKIIFANLWLRTEMETGIVFVSLRRIRKTQQHDSRTKNDHGSDED